MASGKVKFFNQGRGYGFVIPDDGGKDIFLHITNLKASKLVGPLNEDDRLTFEVQDGPRGPTAVKVSRL